jgi:methylmalonyl-CoA mutase
LPYIVLRRCFCKTLQLIFFLRILFIFQVKLLIINYLIIKIEFKTASPYRMSDSIQNLFQEFEATTKAQWLARVERDLKGKQPSELNFDLPHLIISPFAHADDHAGEHFEPIIGKVEGNSWAIGENIDINNDNFKEANQKALTALMGGANALFFNFNAYPIDNQLNTLLENIEFEYIESHFYIRSKEDNLLSFLEKLKKIIFKKEKNAKIWSTATSRTLSGLRGSVSTDSKEVTIDVLLWIKENLPLFKIINIDGSVFHKGSEQVVQELTEILLAGEKQLNYLKNNELNIDLFKNNIQFNVTIGISYFIEIAKIRALKLLWGNVLKAYEVAPILPNIQAKVSKQSFVEDAHKNKISVTTQAMTAVLAGVESLTIDPTEDSDFGKRISRNVQHLLQLESYLDRVADPSAGSYYIEQLTNQIAEKVWQRFQEKV